MDCYAVDEANVYLGDEHKIRVEGRQQLSGQDTQTAVMTSASTLSLQLWSSVSHSRLRAFVPYGLLIVMSLEFLLSEFKS